MDSKSSMSMDKNRKDTKNTNQIYGRVNFVRNVENWKIHTNDWCEGGLQLAYIATKNICENYLNTRIEVKMIGLDNWDRTLVQEGWQDKGYFMKI